MWAPSATIRLVVSRLEELLPLIAKLTDGDDPLKSLADLANEDGRSPFHLQRIIRREMGESPLQHRQRVRLQRAAAALVTTRKSVLDVALEAGFESHEGFSRAFRARFGLAPKKFREQCGQLEPGSLGSTTHAEIAHRAAPCVGLFRVSTADSTDCRPHAVPPGPSSVSTIPTGERSMSYEIAKKTRPETPFLFMRRQVKKEAIAETLGTMFPAVFQYATAQGIAFAGPPTARYIFVTPGLITIEAGLPVVAPAEGEGEIELGSLMGGAVATTVHKGPYDQLEKAHEAMESWLVEHGETAAGAPWEVYVTDPGEVPDPAEWLTEVNWPLCAS